MASIYHSPSQYHKLTYDWIPKCKRLLDAGCSWGDDTVYLKDKAKEVYGIDIIPKCIENAKRAYPEIKFSKSSIERTSFRERFFDVIILNEVLEHVDNENRALNEIFRILKPKGTLILTVPHKGLFSFMDPANYKRFILTHFRTLYPVVHLLVKKEIFEGGDAVTQNIKYHKHYSIGEIKILLNKTRFKDNYRILRAFRSGLVAGVLAYNLKHILKIFLGEENTNILLKPLYYLAKLDYYIPYGPFSYFLAIKLIKK